MSPWRWNGTRLVDIMAYFTLCASGLSPKGNVLDFTFYVKNMYVSLEYSFELEGFRQRG